MISDGSIPMLKRLGREGGFKPRMLMIGALESKITGFPRARDWFASYVGDAYDDLDLADADLILDLNDDLSDLSQKYGSVVNLGTLEHVWNAHAAWCNALRAVEVCGSLVVHAPVGGWTGQNGLLNHGVHQTRANVIQEFIALNGFEIHDSWVDRGKRGMKLNLRAVKHEHVEAIADFRIPLQVRGMAPIYRKST